MKLTFALLAITSSLIGKENTPSKIQMTPPTKKTMSIPKKPISSKATPSQQNQTTTPLFHQQTDSGERSILAIDPKNRALDFVQAYEILKKDKPSLKIAIRTPHQMLSGIASISMTTNGTLLIVKLLSHQGAELKIVPVEEIVEMTYLP